ncbi:MAG: 23S rRNA (pseudouridine(1915)-N(3))-methyltransferase RlmH, partial [Saprospiraceae bacterium]|nr:23S rRNA (pseudouridine(1915)-N(3))-methyltransferase RlmH [Saprospiraceae bacterium]
MWVIGKTAFKYLDEGIAIYGKRLKHYVNFELVVLPDVKNPPLSIEALKTKEGELILNKLQKDDLLILLDENGKHLTSIDFSKFIDNQQMNATKRLISKLAG